MQTQIHRWSWPLTAKQSATFYNIHKNDLASSFVDGGNKGATLLRRRRRSSLVKFASTDLPRRNSIDDFRILSSLSFEKGPQRRISLTKRDSADNVRTKQSVNASPPRCNFVTCEESTKEADLFSQIEQATKDEFSESHLTESIRSRPRSRSLLGNPPSTLWVPQPSDTTQEDVATTSDTDLSEQEVTSTPIAYRENTSEGFLDELSKNRGVSKKQMAPRELKKRKEQQEALGHVLDSLRMNSGSEVGMLSDELDKPSERLWRVRDKDLGNFSTPEIKASYDSQSGVRQLVLKSGCPLSVSIILSSLASLNLKVSHLHVSARGRIVRCHVTPESEHPEVPPKDWSNEELQQAMTKALGLYHPVGSASLASCILPDFCREEVAAETKQKLLGLKRQSDAMIFWLRDLKENRTSRMTISVPESPFIFFAIQEALKKMNVDFVSGVMDVKNGNVNGTIECQFQQKALDSKLQNKVKADLLKLLDAESREPMLIAPPMDFVSVN